MKIENSKVESTEEHIDFSWTTLKELLNINFLPEKMATRVIAIIEDNSNFWDKNF